MMKKLSRKAAIALRITSTCLLLGLAVISAVLFKNGIMNGFTDENGFILLSPEIPAGYIAISVSFTVLFLAVLVSGTVFKDLILLAISSAFSLIAVASVVMLGLFSSGAAQGTAAMWISFILISPFYGTLWLLGLFAIVIYAAAVITSIIGLIIALKRK